jgi:hypothetical protein
MNRFYGIVGFVKTDDDPHDSGICEPKITEKKYYGNFLSQGYRLDESQKINPDIQLLNRVSLFTDRYAFENLAYIAYVKIAGTKWAVSSVEYQGKRLICSFKGIYKEAE